MEPCQQVRLPLPIKLFSLRKELLQDFDFGGVAAYLALRIKEDVVGSRDGSSELELRQNSAWLAFYLSEVGHLELKVHSVLLVVLSDVRYLIFLGQLFEEVLVVPRPLSYGKLSYLELCVGLNAIDACASVALLAAFDRLYRP